MNSKTDLYEPADIVICIQGKGLALKEKSLVAYDPHTKKILAIGTDAERMVGKESEHVRVMSPLRRGRIADFSASVQMFAHLLEKAWGKKTFFKYQIAVFVSEEVTEVEKKALEDVLFQSRARTVAIVPVSERQLAAIAERSEHLPDGCEKYNTNIVITKDEPEKYIMEELGLILAYAGEMGISAERIADLMRRASEKFARK